jgi:ABC-2 type transport system ATP-binding protein
LTKYAKGLKCRKQKDVADIMITVKNLTKYYGNKLGVEDVNFHIDKGEIVGMLGPNGAGKSTIMRMLASYMPPTSGEIQINGADIVSDPTVSSMHIGYLPELPPLYMEMSVKRYLHFLAQIRRVPKDKRDSHITEAMELANIIDVQNRLIRNLSKGYRQRVGIAQALIGRPEVLIFDEPTVGLDPKQISEVRSLIEMLSHNHTILLSSHILSEIRMTCNRVLIINKGRLLADDTFSRLSEDKTLRYIVQLKSNTDEAQKALLAIPGILSAEPTGEAEENGCTQLCIALAPESNVLDRLSVELAARNIALYELKQAKKTLEEVFLAIISEKMPEKEEA